MKKKILSIAFGLAIILTTATCYAENKNPITPQEKATKAFNKEFNNSIVPTVYLNEGGFILKAISDGHNITSAYNKKGNWVYTIKQYSSERLVKNVIDIVQNGYDSHGYYITTMKKITLFTLYTCKAARLLKLLKLLITKWKKWRFYRRHNFKNIFSHSLACDFTGIFVK